MGDSDRLSMATMLPFDVTLIFVDVALRFVSFVSFGE